ncbi:addiction module protein [Roseimaritima sediminicola]|uniref:addiction module protein n=1 Tax=Roseimaritima sediminicola TaxID=2662066 RepID=UPI0012982B22|nr:addiction module protein [Roseimaritima sediminicola]
MINASELADLPTDLKIQLITELWDQIAAQPEPPQLPEWVHDEAERRFDRLERNSSIGLTEEQMWQEADDARRTL